MEKWETTEYLRMKGESENRENEAWKFIMRLQDALESRGYTDPEYLVSDLFMIEASVKSHETRLQDVEQLFVTTEDFNTMLNENPNIRDTYKQLLMYVAIEKGKQHQNGN